MLTLIRKDLLLHKVAFYGFTPAAVVYLGWFASQIDSPNVFTTFACIFASVLPLVLIAREDVFHAEAFICSLPVTRRQVVHAKYAVSWALALIFTVIGLVLYSIFAAEGLPAIWSVSTGNRILLTLSVGLGVALPFSLRFGWLGLTVLGVGTQLLGLVVYLTVKALATRLSLGNIFAAARDQIERLHSWLGEPLFLAAVICVLVAFNFASCRIAVALFERREF